MKKFRLKQWYPRIPVYLEDGYVISFDENKGIAIYEFVNGTLDTFEMSGAELECTQYWELIEEGKPLFITDDNIEVFSEKAVIYIVTKTFYKRETELCNIYDKSNREDFKYFLHEYSADEYILWNKPLLSLKDIDETVEMYTHEFDELRKIAKGRRAK